MAINFPTGQTLNQIYTYGGYSWQWNGNYWQVYPQGLEDDTFVTGFTLSNNLVNLTQNRTDNYSAFTISLSAYTGSTGVSGDYLPLSGGTLTGGLIANSGITANTISSTTYFNLPVSGLTEGNNISITGANGNFRISFTGTTGSNFTGGTVSGATIFTNGLTANTISATTYQNLPVSGLTGGDNISVTGSNGNFTISFTGTTGSNFTGGTVSGATIFTDGLTANTISATTYYNLPYSGTVNGGGTTNYIPKFTGSTGIGNSQLQDNGSQVFTNQGYGSTLTGNLSINASGTTGIASRATQYCVYGTISGTTAGAAAIRGEANVNQNGVYGISSGDDVGEYIGVAGFGIQGDTGVAGTVYIGGKFYGDNGTGGGYSVQLQDGTEGVGKVLVSQTSDGKANWNTFSGINITITSAATNTLVFSAATGGGGGGGGGASLGTVYTTANNFNFL